MKTEIVTIASSGNRVLPREVEERQNEQLLSLYKQYQEKPFDYAVINCREDGKSEIKVFRQKPKNTFPKVKQFFKNLFHSILKTK